MKKIIPLLLLLASVAADAAEHTGTLTGTITSRDASANELTVAHGDVAGLMDAMTMAYEVRGQKVDALPPDGTKITATLHEDDAGAYWLTDVKTIADAAQTAPAAMPGMEHQMHEHAESPQHADMPGMHHDSAPMQMHGDATSELLMRQASGTSMNPAAAPMHMSMWHRGDWMLMLHGLAFVNQVWETGHITNRLRRWCPVHVGAKADATDA